MIADFFNLKINKNANYRSEIDGLRGISVIAVILYHSGIELFQSGYLGVDVFFIISGYLITNIIIQDVLKNRFSFLNFFERRARRILPLLFFVCLSITPFAWYFFSSVLLESFGETLISINFFASNVLFFLTAGYFNLVSELKPLIHTWSLSVEEQFYIIFPFFILFILRFNKISIYLIFISLIILSFFLGLFENIFIFKNINNISLSNKSFTSFFLLPGRVWQLLLGGIIAIYLTNNKIINSNLLSLLGLAIIIFSLFFNNHISDSYVLNSLLPSLGAFLILLFSGKKSITKRILSIKIFIFFGLISYSLYLWHQPIFTFLRIYNTNITLSNYDIFYSTLLAILISIITWKFIELPNRNKDLVPRKILIIKLIIMYLIILFIGIFFYVSNGGYKLNKLEKLYPNIEFNKKENLIKYLNYLKIPNETFDKNSDTINILIVGDSHSQDLFIALNQTNELKYKYKFANIKVNSPLNLDLDINSFKESDVIIVTYASSHLNNLIKEDDNFLTKLKYFFKKNQKYFYMTTSSLYFPYYGDDILSQIINKWHLHNDDTINVEYINYETYDYMNKEIITHNLKFIEIFNKLDINYLDKMEYICPEYKSKRCYGVTNNFEKIYFDGSHTTLEGAKFFGNNIYKNMWLKKIDLLINEN